MSGPTFLGIGAQKAGTTWLYRGLELHPDIWLPPVKELHFFDERIRFPQPGFDNIHGTHGPSKRWRRQLHNERRRRRRVAMVDDAEARNRAWCSEYFFGTPSIDWYRSLFTGHLHSGEVTPEYAALDAEMIDTVVAALPEIRVIYLLRNPIEREWSAALMATRSGNREPEAVLRQNRRHVRYGDNIDRWTAALPPGRFYLGFTEDLRRHPDVLMADIVEFIGADPGAARIPTGRPNSGGATSIPGPFATALADELSGEIDRIARRFGGPATSWAQAATWLQSNRPTGDLAYPLAIDSGAGEQSGLSSIVI